MLTLITNLERRSEEPLLTTLKERERTASGQQHADQSVLTYWK